MSAKTTIAIRRNTAMATQSLVEVPCLSLLRPEVAEGQMLWSFDPTDPQNEALVYLVDGQATREWTQHVSEPFQFVAWTAKAVMVESTETGELVRAVRIVLIDNNRDTLAFASTGVAASLDLIRTLRGDGPYDPPIPLVVLPLKTRGGRQTLKLIPVMAPPKKVIITK